MTMGLRTLAQRVFAGVVLVAAQGTVVRADESSAQCRAVQELQASIDGELERLGQSGSMRLDDIARDNGLPTAGGDGRWILANCARAIPVLDRFLADLRAEVADAALAEKFTLEAVRVRNDDGVWRASFGGDAVVLRAHDGSGLAWESGPGERRVAWYWAPREGLSKRGAQQGALLFEGDVVDGRLRGTARLFTGDCGVFAYAVEGVVVGAVLRIVFRGEAPRVSSNCQVTGVFDDELVLEFLADAPPPADELADLLDPTGGAAFGRGLRVAGKGVAEVRQAPGPRFAVIGELPADARDVSVVDGCIPRIGAAQWLDMDRSERVAALDGAWCHVSWQDQRGWVLGQQLRPQ